MTTAFSSARDAITSWSDRIVGWTSVALVVAAVVIATDGLERLNTWYLASDQFAFLTFAGDLREGTVFHEDENWRFIAPRSPLTYDALAQTYFWRDGKLFSRYPPGFPAMLAVVGAVAGETGQHWLNPLLFLVVMVLLAATPLALLPGDRRLAAATGAASAWLLLLLPTEIHLWGITVARDLPAHLFGLLSVLAASRRRYVLSGVILGFASVIRPDAVLYGVSIGVVALLRRPRFGQAVAATLAYVAAASPLFFYNWVTQGSPFSFTQGGEFKNLLGAAPVQAPVAVAQTVAFASGGAFRFANLAQSLPGNLEHLAEAYGWLLGPGLLGILWGLFRRPLLLAGLLPYPLVALVFYSFWSHPDPRYLAGVALCSMPLVGFGLVLAAERATDPSSSALWRIGVLVWAAVVVASRLGGLPGVPMASAPAWVTAVTIAAAALFAVMGGVRPRSWIPLAVLVPALALAGVGIRSLAVGGERRDPFQRPQVERARTVLEAAIPPGSLVITDSGLGRTAENISHYTGIRAVYGSELDLVGILPTTAVIQHHLNGRRVFYLIDNRDRYSLHRLRDDTVQHRLVEKREGLDLLEWFVNPREATNGAALYEVEPTEKWTSNLDDLVEAGMVPPYPAYKPRTPASATP